MKCIIIIKGQLQGNFELDRKMHNYTHRKKHFNGHVIELEYNTLKEARDDLKHAYKRLKEEEPDYEGINYSKDYLEYDASSAKILKN